MALTDTPLSGSTCTSKAMPVLLLVPVKLVVNDAACADAAKTAEQTSPITIPRVLPTRIASNSIRPLAPCLRVHRTRALWRRTRSTHAVILGTTSARKENVGTVIMRRVRNWAELKASRAFPSATVAVLALTIVLTIVQIAVPDLRLDLWRDEDALKSGQLWRVATPLLIQYDPWWNAAIVLALIGLIGTAAERVYGSARWLVIYLICGITGQAFGYLWAPADAGASVACAGLLGALGGWALRGSSLAPRPVRNTAWLALAGGVALTAVGDMHGPPLLLGFALAPLLTGTSGPRDREIDSQFAPQD